MESLSVRASLPRVFVLILRHRIPCIWRNFMLFRRAAIAAALTCGLAVTVVPATARAAPAAGLRAYFVITAPNDTAGAKTAVANNGGTVFASYDAIGVIVAHSTSTTFAATMRGVSGVQKVGATRTTDVPAEASNPAIPTLPAEQTPTAAERTRPDMSQTGADRANTANQGSPSVTVGVLDTGGDDHHFDRRANFTAARSPRAPTASWTPGPAPGARC